MAVIDLYSGIGGWSLGFKMAGIPILSSYEWWKDANRTHNKNFDTSHSEIDIRKLALADLPNPQLINYVVGSPPCTQFSLANRGGKGDITDGLIDIQKFLEVVEYAQPLYWAMENVPRVAGILEKELSKGGSLERFKYLFGDIRIYKASDFGVPQDRKRMIAGKFPFQLLDSYRERTPSLTLGNVLNALDQDVIVDPIYQLELQRNLVTDHVLEPSLSLEEERLNRDSKTYHPVYNVMSFPDRTDRPSRTVTALCTRVSRESIIIQDRHGNIRRLTIRERGCLQSFPINYQYFANTYAGKIKMIGNAVPPVLTFYIAQSMLETPVGNLILPDQVDRQRLVLGAERAETHQPDNEGANYPWNRSFWLAIPGLRLGSGVRFELKNSHNKEEKTTDWKIQFFYGNSKKIKAKALDLNLFNRVITFFSLNTDEIFIKWFGELRYFIKTINKEELQLSWTHVNRKLPNPIFIIDEIARYVREIKTIFLDQDFASEDIIRSFVNMEFRSDGKIDNKKLIDHALDVLVGMMVGSIFNSIMESGNIELNLIQQQEINVA